MKPARSLAAAAITLATFSAIPAPAAPGLPSNSINVKLVNSGDGGGINGSRATTLTPANLNVNEAGKYAFVVTNLDGNVTRGPVSLIENDVYALGVSVLDREGIYVFFSTNMDARSALDANQYSINHGLVVTNAAFVPALATNGPQSAVRLDVAPVIGFFNDYSLTISNVASAGGYPLMPNPTVLPFQLNYRNLGYLYFSPLPGAVYVSFQTTFVLARFTSLSPTAVTNLATFITVNGSVSGIHNGLTHVASDGRTVIFTMSDAFATNELVTVGVAPRTAAGTNLDAYQYQFVVASYLPDPPLISARGDAPPDDSMTNAFDGDLATKWLDDIVPNGTTNFSWIQYLYPDKATEVVGQYAVTSAGDSPERDPADWNFYGVGVSSNLVLLDRQTNQTFSARYQTKVYSINNLMDYRGYRLQITRVNNPGTATGVQLAELAFTQRQGRLLCEYWLNLPGNAISNLTSNPAYPNHPSGNNYLGNFEAPTDWGVNYGRRVRGYLTAPATGTYHFWIASDDNSELWLSTTTDPANARLIASVPGWTSPEAWSTYPQQQSAGINLTAGQSYYIEALHKQGGGGDNLAVGWARPGEAASAPSEVIPGAVLTPWTPATGAPVVIDAKLSVARSAVTARPMAETNLPAATNPPTVGATPKFAILSNGVSVPSDFPQVTNSATGNPSSDYIWMENMGPTGQMYQMILDNHGNPVYYQRGGAQDFKPQKNGLITWGTGPFTAVDNNFNYVRTYTTANGYGPDSHELQIMADGSYFIIGYNTETVDMTRYVTNGNPAALVVEYAIQQFTAQDDLIFQWRAWDHISILDQQDFIDLTSASFDFPHMNSVDVDDDGNILLSSRSTSECTKINRDTGDIIWRMGGAHSTLTFVNDPLNGPRNQHCLRALGNGHYTLFDDGNLHDPPVSRACEYVVDTNQMTATLVWEFRDTPDKYAYYMGNIQRLTNGNTHINWVLSGYPKAVEVNSNGVKQMELSFTQGSDLYRSWRFPWTGVVAAPYLITESYPDNVTLIFNKFGDTNVAFYRIYGGTVSQSTNLLATSGVTLAKLSNLTNGSTYYFRVTAVSKQGVESPFSNEASTPVNIIPPGQNMVRNGGFTQGTNSWIWTLSGGATAAWTMTNGLSHVTITNGTTALANIQLQQTGLPMVQSNVYVFQFEAWSAAPRYIQAMVAQAASPYLNYSGTTSTYLTPMPTQFRYVFTMTAATDLDASLIFNLGDSPYGVYLENVSLFNPPTGDLNQDGRVDLLDLQILAGEWLKQQSGLNGDLNGSGQVDFNDFGIMGDNWSPGQ